jgi:hypothetical protein
MTPDGVGDSAGAAADGLPRHSIRVILPPHLRALAGTGAEVIVAVPGPATLGSVLEAIEAAHPALRGTIRDVVSGHRRPFIRFFALGEDLSLLPGDHPLPAAVAEGKEPLRIVGAIAGGGAMADEADRGDGRAAQGR